jgi:hypothetical protein
MSLYRTFLCCIKLRGSGQLGVKPRGYWVEQGDLGLLNMLFKEVYGLITEIL